MAKKLFKKICLGQAAKISATESAKPRLSNEQSLQQPVLSSTSNSQKTLLCELIHSWLLFHSTHCDNENNQSIGHFRNMLAQHLTLKNLLDRSPLSGEPYLFSYINDCHARRDTKSIDELLALFMDARAIENKNKAKPAKKDEANKTKPGKCS